MTNKPVDCTIMSQLTWQNKPKKITVGLISKTNGNKCQDQYFLPLPLTSENVNKKILRPF